MSVIAKVTVRTVGCVAVGAGLMWAVVGCQSESGESPETTTTETTTTETTTTTTETTAPPTPTTPRRSGCWPPC